MKTRTLLAVSLLAAAAAGTVFVVASGPAASTTSIRALAQQPGAVDPDSLSAQLIPGEDLPPAGTRSLFDHLIAQNGQIPYPFDRLVALIPKNDPDAAPPLRLLIPRGRSLLKGLADDAHPRVLAAADFQAKNTPAAYGLAARGQLFLGFVENASEIEVLSYNEAAGRYEFQLVQNYCEGCIPKLVYARRAICLSCHQGATPIFPVRPWNETNGQPETAAKIVAARGNAEPYLGVPAANALAVPERFEELANVGAFIPATQRVWIDACGDAESGMVCRRQMLKVALRYLSNPAEFDALGTDAQKLRELQAAHWPRDGIAVAQSDLPNRDPLAEKRGFRGAVKALFTRPPKPGEGAKTNEDLEAFDRLPKLPALLDPLSPRAPKRVLSARDIDGAYGLAAMLTEADYRQLEAAAKFDLPSLLAAVDHADAGLYAPAVYSRVKTMNALLAALGAKPLGYCCLSTAEMSQPVASGEPPVAIAAGSPLAHFEQYCFACHRGNPSKKLNFMSGATEAEVLEQIKAKGEIREALDWPRYRNTDKANKLMPPADSVQRRKLEAAVAQDPKLLDTMRAIVPGLFDF
ncbi:MAG: hypothetical protein NVS9B10_28240 [Nevskia sp.]